MKKLVYSVVAFAPVLASAQTLDNVDNLITTLGGFVGRIIPIIFGIAIIYFFWGLAKFIRSAGDPKAQAEGKSIMIYGVIALAVMVSVYGLIAWLGENLDVDQGGTVVLPTVPGLGGTR